MRYLVIAAVFAAGFSVSRGEEAPAAGTASVDPFAPDAGDFLDADLGVYREAAEEAYRAGDYREAARNYLLYLRGDIHAAAEIYNLACCYALLGDADLAARYLDRAARVGYDDLAWLREDPDFAKVRGAAPFDAAVARLVAEAAAREKERGGVYVAAPIWHECRVILPAGYKTGEKYPLVVGLHGRGGDAGGFARLWNDVGGGAFIYAVPEAPYATHVGARLGYMWNVAAPGDEWSARGRKMSADYIAAVVKELKKRYRVGDVYLLGFSQGASFAYVTALAHAGVCRGIICFGGWFEKDWFAEDDLEAARDLRVFISHGRADGTVPFEEGVEARDILTKYGCDVTFVEVEGGHAVPVEHLKLVREWITY